jgi:glutamine synthetase
MLASGLDGIKNKIMPPECTNTNIYHLDEKARKRLHIEMLPGSLMESNIALKKDDVLCKTLGDHVVSKLSSIAQMETDSFRLAVHPWELDRYLATY